jgi:hypothetical protein
MKKRTGRWLGQLALAAGALGVVGAFAARRGRNRSGRRRDTQPGDVWARPNMAVTFRAELMPGRDRTERTFRVKELLASGRVLLQGVSGEHAAREFEPLR